MGMVLAAVAVAGSVVKSLDRHAGDAMLCTRIFWVWMKVSEFYDL